MDHTEVEECWSTHKQVGTKMKGGKRVDNCVKIKEELLGEVSDAVKLRYISKANREKQQLHCRLR